MCALDQVFGLAVNHMVREALRRELTPDERFAVQVLTQSSDAETFSQTRTSNLCACKYDPLSVFLSNISPNDIISTYFLLFLESETCFYAILE